MAWKKGQSGNPGGRPSEKVFTDAIRIVVAEEDPVRKKRKLRCLAEKLYEEAMNGEGWAICQIGDRLDGKPAQEQTVTTMRLSVNELSDEDLIAIIEQGNAAQAQQAGDDMPPTAAGNGKLN
jgi:Family of unknown function (DUF5681)